MIDLIQQAQAMLLDRHPDEAKLIYYIAKMDPEERGAIIIAYQNIMRENDNHFPDTTKNVLVQDNGEF